MKQINFTCKEKLPYLLALKPGDEIQTIRKAWENILTDCAIRPGRKRKSTIPKPPKYKVGDVVPFVWDRDSKDEWFYKLEGTPALLEKPDVHVFNKILGEVKITEVFEIEMRKDFERYKNTTGHGYGWEIRFLNLGNPNEEHVIPINNGYHTRCFEFAKRDGFGSAEEMFKYFDKNYDLSTPKKFYVYRGKML